ncbi:MAG: glycosyltransferase [Ruminococcus flavefaciens]|nr:glycosyltransferase [Ruminococcus flavefaciens]
MTTSVCMGIYNGENYIEEQLASILRQTKRADEVILCDDNSTDGTVEIVRSFIEGNGLQGSWKLLCNRGNRGYPGNFYHAMSLCKADIVFLADQDDIWDDHKIERMCAAMEEKKEARVISCKFGLVDGDGKKIRTVMTPVHSGNTGELREIPIETVFYKCEWPGMALAYRNAWYREWTERLRQNGDEEVIRRIPHDLLLCAGAAEEHGFYQLDQELAWHRRHSNNAGGEEHRIKKLLRKERKLGEIWTYLKYLQAFLQGAALQTEEGRAALRRKLDSMQGRYEALQSGHMRSVIWNAWRNRDQVRIATVVCDLAIVKQRGGTAVKAE